ncbi:glycine zipper 2TM domain-containing protein [Salinisphaera sp. T31B1]|uniref:glycine zipper 2TM domain-containing protein n=1 Tax=Salinisphaera sp. T31B1 TaxID=727963 RepID=UPI00334235B1
MNSFQRSSASRSARLMPVLAAALVTIVTGCASNPKPDVDPIFTAVPGGRYDCYTQQDDRNVFAKGATSTAGQAVIGGAAGGLLGNQFGSGTGRDIGTGLGVAAGAAAGAWNARRMQNNRLDHCLQRTGGQNGNAGGYRYQGS